MKKEFSDNNKGINNKEEEKEVFVSNWVNLYNKPKIIDFLKLYIIIASSKYLIIFKKIFTLLHFILTKYKL